MSEPTPARAAFSVRALVSMTMVFAFTLLALSGLLMYFWHGLPSQRPLGLDRGQWNALHTVLSLLVVLTALLHVGYNWGPIKHYLVTRAAARRRLRAEWLVALALVGVITLGTAAYLPPFSLLAPREEHHGPPPAAAQPAPTARDADSSQPGA